jgi:hypothetical protein
MRTAIERILTPTVVAAVVAAIAAYAASSITARSAEEQLEANLIVEAVKVCDKHQAFTNLRFLMKAGFLPDHSKGLQQAIDEGLEKYIPPNNCANPHSSN